MLIREDFPQVQELWIWPGAAQQSVPAGTSSSCPVVQLRQPINEHGAGPVLVCQPLPAACHADVEADRVQPPEQNSEVQTSAGVNGLRFLTRGFPFPA